MNLAELVLERAAHAGDVEAVRMGADALTFAELAAESERVALGLRDLGVTSGDRVLMFASNCVEYLVTYLAVARLGAIFTPVHASFQVSELQYVLANATPKAVVTEAALWERLQRCDHDMLPEIRVVIDKPQAGLHAYRDLGRGLAGSVGVTSVHDDDPVLICYTSGTTDRPHPVTRSHAHEIWNATTYAKVWDFQPGDRALVTLPLSWVWGLSTLSQALLHVGATVILHTDFEPKKALEEIGASRITLFTGTMSMYTALQRVLDEGDYDLSSLRRVYRGGEPINDEIVHLLETRIGVRFSDAYATTEAAPVLAVDPTRDTDAPPGTVGKLVPGAQIRLVNDYGEDVAVGEVGEAWLGGRGLMLGYWNEPELTAERLTGGWFHSGDLLVQREDGYFFVVGRSADVIIRNGAKIAPAEIESALTGVLGVRDSVAVGVPDDEFGESIVAFLVRDPDVVASIDDVYDHLSDRIARFKLPSHIYFVDKLPIRRNQKRDRAWIRQYALETLARESGLDHGPTTIDPTDGRNRLRLVQ
ncbi:MULTISPECIES: class I adenylate-forming enzyme family protein [unclassified Mycolicibacterium]|uniref:class I adenylate-forming enzyme family protein n=1 Tax=unclassified Mycolicibacterium TaxID=2636767 RepID=UPI0012DCA681|nr:MULTISPECIES: class I adenylate-forming enzyme family protein [unclassified Mycolicibacterium]MUL74431.1 acyl--CoA ligase [Mycolicibacterium sp. CBMA 311]MUL97249.1 acyl--CoA ligase [Mycolicibacterium sp. CBMA 230]